jgi:hypothetical protein
MPSHFQAYAAGWRIFPPWIPSAPQGGPFHQVQDGFPRNILAAHGGERQTLDAIAVKRKRTTLPGLAQTMASNAFVRRV